jgi:hypothetical protein
MNPVTLIDHQDEARRNRAFYADAARPGPERLEPRRHERQGVGVTGGDFVGELRRHRPCDRYDVVGDADIRRPLLVDADEAVGVEVLSPDERIAHGADGGLGSQGDREHAAHQRRRHDGADPSQAIPT